MKVKAVMVTDAEFNPPMTVVGCIFEVDSLISPTGTKRFVLTRLFDDACPLYIAKGILVNSVMQALVDFTKGERMKAIVINRESGERTVISDVIGYRIVYPDDERDFHWAIQMPLGHIVDVPHRKFDCFFANK